MDMKGNVTPAGCGNKLKKRVICNCKIITNHKFRSDIMKSSYFSALQLICRLPNHILSNTIISEYNTTAGPNGEMAEGEVIRYVEKGFHLNTIFICPFSNTKILCVQ